MKVRNSIKSLKNRHRDCRVIRVADAPTSSTRRIAASRHGKADFVEPGRTLRISSTARSSIGKGGPLPFWEHGMRSESRIEAVVFDVGRVIVQWDLGHLVRKMVDDPAEARWVLDHVLTERWHFQHDAGRPLADMLPERKALFPRYAHVLDAYATRFTDTIPGRVEGTAELIERLHERGIPLFAITNFGDEFWDQFYPTEPVLERFSDIVVSGRERMMKPDAPIFRLAAKRFGHAPEAMLFIDDNAANIAAADALGWQTHQFSDAARLEADLVERGLLD